MSEKIKELFPQDDFTAVLNVKEDPCAVVALRAYAMASTDYEIKTGLFSRLGGLFAIQITMPDLTVCEPLFCTGYHESHDRLIVQLADGSKTFFYGQYLSHSISHMSEEQCRRFQAQVAAEKAQQEQIQVGNVPVQAAAGLSSEVQARTEQVKSQIKQIENQAAIEATKKEEQ